MSSSYLASSREGYRFSVVDGIHGQSLTKIFTNGIKDHVFITWGYVLQKPICNKWNVRIQLTHWGQDKMAAIFQTTF